MTDVDLISLMAYRNEKPGVRNLTVPQWLLWYRLRDVYKENADNPEKGAEEKQKQVSQYEEDCKNWVKTKEVLEHLSSQWKRIEPAARMFALDPTVEHGVKLFEELYVVPMKKQVEYWDREDNNGEDL